MPVDQALATFKDRHTLVYERHYPHSIEDVFAAVSTAEQLDAWMCPECRVERRAGGACAFGWGSSADHEMASRGVVSVFEPPRSVEYRFDDGSFMRFDLVPGEDGGTHLHFTLHFLPGPDDRDEDYPGGDRPVPGTAWRPGFCAGYHEFLDDLRRLLAGMLDAEAKMKLIEAGSAEPEEELIATYREHLRANCPPA